MKGLVVFLALAFSLSASADLMKVTSQNYMGHLVINDHPTEGICYIRINSVSPNPSKGKHCYQMNTQWMFNLDDQGINSRGDEILVSSRKTNNEAEFHLPTTCAEVTGDVAQPWTVNKWGDDDTHLYTQVYNAVSRAPAGGENHYTLSLNGVTKEPWRAMLFHVRWFSENRYECVDLKPL